MKQDHTGLNLLMSDVAALRFPHEDHFFTLLAKVALKLW